MKALLFLTCAVALISLRAADQNSQRIYTHVAYEVTSAGWIGEKKSVHHALLTGSTWVLKLGGEKVFVTAAHNLAYGPRGTPSQIGDIAIKGKVKAAAVGAGTVIGTLAYEPLEIGLISPTDDILLIRAEDGAYSHSKAISLARRTVEKGEKVTVCGFPGTSHEQIQQFTVTAVYSKHFVLDQPVHAGCSGGVVLNESGNAVGMITGTEEKQATAIMLRSDFAESATWDRIKRTILKNHETR